MNSQRYIIRRKAIAYYFIFFLIAIFLTGCGSNGGGGETTGSVTTGNKESTGIGPGGGTVTSSDGKVKVVIPSGALTQTTDITVAAASSTPSGNIGTAYEIGTDGTTFTQPITIFITYDETSLPSGVNEGNLRLGVLVNGIWEEAVGSTVDPSANTVSGTFSQFSIYGIVVAGVVAGVDSTAPATPTGVTPPNISTNLQATALSSSQVNLTGTDNSNNSGTSLSAPTGVTASPIEGQVEVSATPVISVTPPDIPTNLQATAVSSSQVNLAWADNSTNEDGFNIERKSDTSGAYSQIAVVGANITNYSDMNDLAANTVYCYQIRAFNSAGNSGYSNESCTTTPQSETTPSIPTGVTASPDDGQVLVTWNPVPGATSYNLYMASQSGVTKDNYSTLTDGMKHTGVSNPFIHTGLANGIVYYFVVTSVNAGGESSESIQVRETPSMGTYLGTFALTGRMTIAHYGHTATLLSNEKVLIAGGLSSGDNFLDSADIYDPNTDEFTSTGRMTIAHYGHTATLLPNGKVLIAGGLSSGGSFLDSAELYDPSTGTFTSTGRMITTRFLHTATLLSNGKVLIAGGLSSEDNFLDSAELYDPSTGTFTSTGRMTTARFLHTATLLFNGKVLIAGGSVLSSSGFFDTAELYDPSTGTFSSTGSMTTQHSGHTATLLSNGKVLIAGGSTGKGGTYLDIAELFQ